MSKLTGREKLLMLLGCGITLLLVISVYAVYGRGVYSTAVVSFAVAAGLAFIFFRHRKVILTISGLSFLWVNVGLHNILMLRCGAS